MGEVERKPGHWTRSSFLLRCRFLRNANWENNNKRRRRGGGNGKETETAAISQRCCCCFCFVAASSASYGGCSRIYKVYGFLADWNGTSKTIVQREIEKGIRNSRAKRIHWWEPNGPNRRRNCVSYLAPYVCSRDVCLSKALPRHLVVRPCSNSESGCARWKPQRKKDLALENTSGPIESYTPTIHPLLYHVSFQGAVVRPHEPTGFPTIVTGRRDDVCSSCWPIWRCKSTAIAGFVLAGNEKHRESAII